MLPVHVGVWTTNICQLVLLSLVPMSVMVVVMVMGTMFKCLHWLFHYLNLWWYILFFLAHSGNLQEQILLV